MKKLGIALGGGGARAVFHVGLMKTLIEENIPIGQIVGTSMGAIVGAVFATGVDPTDVIDILHKGMPKSRFSLSRLNIFSQGGVKPKHFDAILKKLFGDRLIEDCKIPFSCIAVDLESGNPIEIKEGLVWKAVRASSSLPLILPPIFHQGSLLVDGGILNRLPVNYLRDELAEVKLSSDVTSFKNKSKLSAVIFNEFMPAEFKKSLPRMTRIKHKLDAFFLMWETVLRSIEIAAVKSTDCFIAGSRVDMKVEEILSFDLTDFTKSPEAIEAGRKAMRDRLGELKTLLGQ